ncbi:redoxin domain-containing protein [Ureibacillus chungkukjangi]|uniref:TlpA family protein disulfide reductase n=1 Tax=Ureibacillus chungkukjangi TaxID=1202712 RepID=UPI00203D85CA|nr:redoxin domain-containing protein [Ureibacillus chungkukjangi]MCM3388966.1 redoxin domain-containing protein [Ureibacillus chungkukjangi]
MPRKIVNICFTLIVLVALIYTISSHFFSNNKRQLDVVFDEDLSTSLEQAVSQQPLIDEDEQVVEYRSIDESEFHEQVDGHDHEHEQETEVRALNEKAPNFELKNLNGEKVMLSDLKGKKVFINFWTTWCPPCVKEMPTIQKFYEEHAHNENIEILAVNVTDQELKVEHVKQFAHEYSISFPILLDEKGDVSINYEVLSIPTSVIINEEGMIIEQILGPVTEEMLVSKLLSS